MRIELAEIEEEIEKLDGINLDLMEILIHTDRIYNLCIEKLEPSIKTIKKLYRARTFFEGSLTLLKGILEPNENELISKINENRNSYDYFEFYFDSFLSILDSEQKTLQDSLKTRTLTGEADGIIKINSFREKLIDYTNTLIVYPLLTSLRRFSYIPYSLYNVPKDISKNSLFKYILFREILMSAKIKGSKLRREVSVSSLSGNVTFHEQNITKTGRQRFQQPIEPKSKDFMPPDLDSFDELFGIEDEVNQEEQKYV